MILLLKGCDMLGYAFAELLEAGKRVGPSVGNHMGGPYLPKLADRGDGPYQILGRPKMGVDVILGELRLVRGRWQLRQVQQATGKLSPWVWEDSIGGSGWTRAKCKGVRWATRVYGNDTIWID